MKTMPSANFYSILFKGGHALRLNIKDRRKDNASKILVDHNH